MTPVLEVLNSAGPQQFRELVERVADAVGLSDEDRAATVPSGEPLIRNRVGWSVTYLARAGAVRRPKRGIAEITDRGGSLLAAGTGPVTNEDLSAFEEFRAFRSRAKGKQQAEGVTWCTEP